jgi:O-antigen/teichoic acid export membrane protein
MQFIRILLVFVFLVNAVTIAGLAYHLAEDNIKEDAKIASNVIIGLNVASLLAVLYYVLMHNDAPLGGKMSLRGSNSAYTPFSF